jgi:hypothetical protein
VFREGWWGWGTRVDGIPVKDEALGEGTVLLLSTPLIS